MAEQLVMLVYLFSFISSELFDSIFGSLDGSNFLCGFCGRVNLLHVLNVLCFCEGLFGHDLSCLRLLEDFLVCIFKFLQVLCIFLLFVEADFLVQIRLQTVNMVDQVDGSFAHSRLHVGRILCLALNCRILDRSDNLLRLALDLDLANRLGLDGSWNHLHGIYWLSLDRLDCLDGGHRSDRNRMHLGCHLERSSGGDRVLDHLIVVVAVFIGV